jgi:hypothetical protein
MGWLDFTNGLEGMLDWVSSVDGTPVSGATNIYGSPFTPPANGSKRVLTNDLAQISFDGAGLQSPFYETLAIGNDGTVESDGGASIVISSTGQITGTMVDPNSLLASKIYGVVLQQPYMTNIIGAGVVANASPGFFVLTSLGVSAPPAVNP